MGSEWEVTVKHGMGELDAMYTLTRTSHASPVKGLGSRGGRVPRRRNT